MKKWILPIMAISVILFNYLLSFFPNLVEKIYSEGVFIIIRYVYDYTIGWLPFPFLYIILLFLCYYFIKSVYKIWYDNVSRNYKYFKFFKGSLNVISIIIICFYIFWGFNYNRPAIKEKLGLELKPLEINTLFEETKKVSEKLKILRAFFGKDSLALTVELLPENYETILRNEVKSVLNAMDFTIGGKVRGRIIKPKGILMRFSTAGIYIPHAFEGHVDGGMHHIQWPSALAHEMTHGFGFTDEGECNFIAYLATLNSDNQFLRYSGLLSYWRYLIASLRRADRDRFNEIWKEIPVSIKADLVDIRKYQDRYPDLIPQIRNAIYNRYLKSHGVHEGLLSYSQIVLLVDAWNRKNQEVIESPE
jgi:hypothetical protein